MVKCYSIKSRIIRYMTVNRWLRPRTGRQGLGVDPAMPPGMRDPAFAQNRRCRSLGGGALAGNPLAHKALPRSTARLNAPVTSRCFERRGCALLSAGSRRCRGSTPDVGAAATTRRGSPQGSCGAQRQGLLFGASHGPCRSVHGRAGQGAQGTKSAHSMPWRVRSLRALANAGRGSAVKLIRAKDINTY